jgi:hypothetical protein
MKFLTRSGWGEKRMRNNGFKKEYVTGRKDQWDIDFKIMMKGREVSKTIEQYFEFLKENMSFVITKVSSERADELMEELELI